ncbi:hypothetical protein [Companilactobacillus paralimentarius]|nr:hypothetical protein [Companilactobacillus paralimentarius]
MGRAAGMIRTATAQAMNRTRLQDFISTNVKNINIFLLNRQQHVLTVLI